MKKVIIMVRTSTEAQQVEDQHNEMVQFCKEQGYSEEQMIFVETQGASAAKVDEDYLDMIQQVKEHIMVDGDIDCFAVWHLNRAVRTEKVYVDLKEFLVKHKIQFLVKNPYLRLLNDDGSINMGMELAFSLMSTLAKQDNEERQAKFRRAKESMRRQGKYTGGRTVKTGYRVDENGYVVIDEEKSKFVRLVFSLYATGEYSVRTLFEELKERGYQTNYHLVNRMVADRSYIDGPYPPMISMELWKRCEDVRKKNLISIPKGRRHCFGSGIFRCSKCGNGMIADCDQYRCRKHKKYSAPPHCDNELTIRIENMDGLLWWIASREEIQKRMRMTEKAKEDYEGKIEILKEKISATQKKLDRIDEKRNRIVELYIDGLISKEEKEKRLSGTISEVKTYNDTILNLNERIGALLTLLEGSNKVNPDLEKIMTIYDDVRCEKDLILMNDIVKNNIKMVTSVKCEYRGMKSSQMITVELVTGKVMKFIYVARNYKGHKFFIYKDEDHIVPIRHISRIVRESAGSVDPRAFKKLKDW